MKKLLLVATAGMFLGGTAVVLADRVHDWHDLDEVHKHVMEAIHEMDRARAANHYDMAGHGAKAEEFLHGAERELGMAVASARDAH
jgi:hypothetical protein